jgi:glycosyltransferase involved in cell wall biosynthesis
MLVSVIIPTYNGADKILNIISALESQTFTNFETIVVIDGSTDGTKQKIFDANVKLKNLKIIEQENKGRATVRNRGVKEACGDLLLFFDDDIRPVEECIEVHVKHHLEYQDSIMVGSVVEDNIKMKTDIQKYKARISRVWESGLLVNNGRVGKENLYLTAANMSLSKKNFERLNGFDEQLNDAEDFDISVRAYLANVPVYYREKAIGWHDDFITCKKYIIRQRQYRHAHVLLKKLKPELYTVFNNHQHINKSYIKQFVYKIFANNVWVNLIDKDSYLLMLPYKIRYRLYSLVIAALSVYYPDTKIK